MVDRRQFLKSLGVLTGGVVASLTLPGCWLTDAHKRETMNALFDVLLPSRPGSVGAIETRAVDFFRSDALLETAANLGFLPRISRTLARQTASFLEHTIVATLDTRAFVRRPNRFNPKGFKDVSRSDQETIVDQMFSKLKYKQLMELCRLSALYSFAGATHNDKGLQAMGWPPYLDFKNGRHNNGYSDFTHDKIPEFNGKQVWHIGLPDGNLP